MRVDASHRVLYSSPTNLKARALPTQQGLLPPFVLAGFQSERLERVETKPGDFAQPMSVREFERLSLAARTYQFLSPSAKIGPPTSLEFNLRSCVGLRKGCNPDPF
jgi:hypothetical protein